MFLLSSQILKLSDHLRVIYRERDRVGRDFHRHLSLCFHICHKCMFSPTLIPTLKFRYYYHYITDDKTEDKRNSVT